MVDSISIKAVANVKVAEAPLQAEVRPLTQEDLERYWKEVGEELGLAEMMKNATVSVSEHVGRIDVEAKTTYFADEFKPHRIEVLEALRKKSGMRLLDCKVIPMFVEHESKAYSPDEKYNVMLKVNPALAAMRRIFPEIDY